MSPILPVTEQLRAATRDQQARLESLPFFKALADGALPLASYVGLLRALATLHGVLEEATLNSTNRGLSVVVDRWMPDLPDIQRDLAYFETQGIEDIPDAAVPPLILAEQIRLRGTEDHAGLLGYLYVLRGKAWGGKELRPHLANHFGLGGSNGLAYLSTHETWIKARWTAFTQRMNAVVVDPPGQHRAVEAAREAFEGMEEIIQALYPITPYQVRERVAALNPDAGSHRIPDDPREIQAALRAGMRSWRQFPYYEWRYSSRGKRFTRSDSAWLVTLAEHTQAQVDQQIAWLGRVLASRGMPQWMLELHLEVLYHELVSAVPPKREDYDKLLSAAHKLRALRREHIDDAVFQSLASEFDTAVGADWSQRLPHSGSLLVAAVADEKGGIKNAVTSLESWMTEPSRFPDSWIKAVRTTLRLAREQAN